MLKLWRCKFYYNIKYDLRGHSSKIHLSFCLCYLLIEETNAAKHYERTKFDLYKDDICLVLTLTYVLMDNFFVLVLLMSMCEVSLCIVDGQF